MFILLSVIGCALGGIVRYFGMILVARLSGERFPWGTLLVNALGCFLLGLILGVGHIPSESEPGLARAYAFGVVGFCGGLTTFSTFSLQTLSLVTEQAWGKAFFNITGSVLLCLLCVLCGYALWETVG